jgi:Tfp pilus assembly protein PilF
MLQGWKEIADYLSRDERTVKRWEKQRGLPVRRTPGEGRPNVYVLVAELDEWLSRSPLRAETAEEVTPVAPPAAAPPPQTTHLRSWTLPAAFASLMVAFVAGGFALHAYRVRSTAPLTATHYVSKVPGVNDLYLRAVYFNEQRTPESLNLALGNLTTALAKDPADAPAWSALAQTYILLREYSQMPNAEAYAKARAAALRSIALDPNLAEPHAALAFIEFFWDWNPTAAERDFHTALALDPNSALAHHWYGSMLNHEGRYNEALDQLNRALALQPTSAAILSNRALALGLGGHRAEAMAQLRQVILQNPDTTAPHQRYLFLCTIPPIDYPCFLEQNRAGMAIVHDLQGVADWDAIAHAYSTRGERGMWQARLAVDQRDFPHGDSVRIAQDQLSLGQTDAAFATLDRAFQSHDTGMIGDAMDPLFYSVHQDPRFQALRARLGLPPVR